MTFDEQTLGNFLDDLASKSSAPGGGSAAALAGALGAALVSMVANLTLLHEKYRDSHEEMMEVLARSEHLRSRFVRLMDEDTASFNAFMVAMKLPKGTEEEASERGSAMTAALKDATEIPLATLDCCYELALLANRAARRGNPNVMTDAAIASKLAEAAAESAAYNVRINMPSLKDREFVSRAGERMKHSIDSTAGICRDTKEAVEAAL
jgi:glutamate formiminotransferase/formiminotetrahydrofolate cyclodeaminase